MIQHLMDEPGPGRKCGGLWSTWCGGRRERASPAQRIVPASAPLGLSRSDAEGVFGGLRHPLDILLK